jgi:ABC-type Fe3+ transport system permease subunit
MLGAFRGVDESFLEAARQLGSGTRAVTRDILVPMACPRSR